MPRYSRLFATLTLFWATSCGSWPEIENAQGAWEQLMTLEGSWISESTGEEVVTYRLTAARTVLIETLYPGKPHEMVTMYHRDNEHLVLTHYCHAENQPHMIAQEWDGRTLEFRCDGWPGNVTHHNEGHMHRARLTFDGKDHLIARWFFFEKATEAAPVVLDVVRQR